MQITLITVGKLKERFFTDASQEYEKRLSAFAKLKITEIDAAYLNSVPTENEISCALLQEAKKIEKAIPPGAYVISMCIEGKALSSEDFSQKLSKIKTNSGKICFIIGGSYGIDQSIKKRSDFLLSMSAMTFPHRLARIMLLEQIYRAFKIESGSSYHK